MAEANREFMFKNKISSRDDPKNLSLLLRVNLIRSYEAINPT